MGNQAFNNSADTIPRRGLDDLVLTLLLIFGLFSPTSFSENPSVLLITANYGLCALILSLFAIGRGHHTGKFANLIFFSIAPLLLLFTFTSGLSTLRFGGLVPYAVFSILLMTTFSKIRLPGFLNSVYAMANCLIIAGCFAILIGNEVFNQFLINHYSISYPELVRYMLFMHKPVLTFGSHSVAGLFLYLLFYASLKTYKLRRRKLFLIFAVCYLILMASLLSVTGMVFAILGTIQAAYVWGKMHPRFTVASLAMLAVFAVPAIHYFINLDVENWRDVGEIGKAILTSPDNGFLGRFSPGGTMSYDVQYVADHPFSPVGASDRADLFFGDSGPIEYFLRGSLPLLLLMYGGLWSFLRRNLQMKSDADFLFVVILAFEFGYSASIHFRTLCLLPFFVVYLNSLGHAQVNAPGLSARRRISKLLHDSVEKDLAAYHPARVRHVLRSPV